MPLHVCSFLSVLITPSRGTCSAPSSESQLSAPQSHATAGLPQRSASRPNCWLRLPLRLQPPTASHCRSTPQARPRTQAPVSSARGQTGGKAWGQGPSQPRPRSRLSGPHSGLIRSTGQDHQGSPDPASLPHWADTPSMRGLTMAAGQTGEAGCSSPTYSWAAEHHVVWAGPHLPLEPRALEPLQKGIPSCCRDRSTRPTFERHSNLQAHQDKYRIRPGRQRAP
ncbi:hypothetical protein NDU88_003312 [Pleurodeles waltl]|uniref:Uncharacterized protein n=1 Tax=Pleurodeles waltl TaxID=8319 RepID=A0AAV7Q9A8_PLEWA|nr:hypothetical protein NDU88_003312 [Pleurodeles waltl]